MLKVEIKKHRLLKEQTGKWSQFCSGNYPPHFTSRVLKEKIKPFVGCVMGHDDESCLTVTPWAANVRK